MNIHFGFSYIGLIFLLMLMLPNIIWSKNKPKGYDKYVKNENKVLLLLEWLGEMLVTCLSLIFSDFNINKISNWSSILLIAFIIMILAESIPKRILAAKFPLFSKLRWACMNQSFRSTPRPMTRLVRVKLLVTPLASLALL